MDATQALVKPEQDHGPGLAPLVAFLRRRKGWSDQACGQNRLEQVSENVVYVSCPL